VPAAAESGVSAKRFCDMGHGEMTVRVWRQGDGGVQHKRMARGGHGLPKVLHRPAIPNPALPCRAGGLRPYSTP
jgi:hypothetical protein